MFETECHLVRGTRSIDVSVFFEHYFFLKCDSQLTVSTQRDISQCSSYSVWVCPERAELICFILSDLETILNMKPKLRLKSCFYSSDREILHKELTADMNLNLLSRDKFECHFTDTILWQTSSRSHSTLKYPLNYIRDYAAYAGVIVCVFKIVCALKFEGKKTDNSQTDIWIKCT